MRYTIEGNEYDFDVKMTAAEAMFIQDHAKLGLNEFDSALRKGNPYAVTALVYIMKTRAGEAVRWQDLLGLNLLTFSIVPDAQDEAEPGKPEAPTTSRRGKTRADATTATS